MDILHRQTNTAGGLGLACPACRVPLLEAGEAVRCRSCGGAWPVRDGVPHFVSDHPYWGEIDQDVMQAINRQIQSAPWREVLRGHPSEQVRKASLMMMNADRANWHLLLPLREDSTVLDIGAGSGAVTHAMACAYGHVVAIEPVLDRIEFMRERFRQDGLENVTLVRGHVGQIPLPADSVDLAILNGVLEWVPWASPDGRPRDVQVRALRQVREVLRPGGFLCVGIENRWIPDYFLGVNDPHADLPFVAVLPRPLADCYARWKTGKPYRTHLYSVRGYRRLFRDAGFSELAIYGAVPSYNYPRFIFPLEDSLFAYFSAQHAPVPRRPMRRWGQRALRAVGLDKYLVYSFFLIGRK